MLYLIGLGLSDKELSLKALEDLKTSELIFAEFYTSPNIYNLREIEKATGKKIKILEREDLEGSEGLKILEYSKNKNIALLIPGDPLTGTTHFELVSQAKKNNITVEVVHSSSIFTAVGETGLFLYKFGRTTTLPKKETSLEYPNSPYKITELNLKNGLHTLMLLDIGLRAEEALEILEELERKNKKGIFPPNKKVIILCKLGSKDQKFYYNSFKKLRKTRFYKLPHTIIIPSKLNHKEKEYLNLLNGKNG